MEALQTEVRAKQDWLESLESSYRALRRQKEEAEQRLERSVRILAELEEINRRRDTHPTLLLRRYRDLTEQYRNLAARLESPRESAVFGSGELSRIQNLGADFLGAGIGLGDAVAGADVVKQQVRVQTDGLAVKDRVGGGTGRHLRNVAACAADGGKQGLAPLDHRTERTALHRRQQAHEILEVVNATQARAAIAHILGIFDRSLRVPGSRPPRPGFQRAFLRSDRPRLRQGRCGTRRNCDR